MGNTPQPTLGPRIRAARHLAGMKDVPALAAALRASGVRKLGATKLYRMEREDDPIDIRDLESIADVCGLSLAWFAADLSRLDQIADDPRRVIAREIAAAVERAAERRAGKSEDPPDPEEEAP